MVDLLNIRENTGMSQESLAAYLGITRQALDKAEKGICSLNTSSLLKMSNLQACLERLSIGDNKKQMPVTAEDQQSEISRQEECNYFISVLQRKLKSLEASFKKSLDLYEALCLMQPADEGDELWIKKTKKDIINKLSNCRTAACMRLRKRIYLLTAEAEYISRFVNENQIHL